MKTIKDFKPRHAGPSGNREFNGKKEIDALYDRTWSGYRLKFLKYNPKCYACGDVATVVDHLIPHQGDVKLFKQTDNHLPLCSKCHNKITGLFDRRHVRGSGLNQNKISWLLRNRVINELTFKVRVLPSYP